MPKVVIRRTGRHSPAMVVAGVRHYVTLLARLLRGHPERPAIVRAVVGGDATVRSDPEDGSVTVDY